MPKGFRICHISALCVCTSPPPPNHLKVSHRNCVSLFLSESIFSENKNVLSYNYSVFVKIRTLNVDTIPLSVLDVCVPEPWETRSLTAAPFLVGAEWWIEEEAIWYLWLCWLRSWSRRLQAELLERRPHCWPRGAVQEDLWRVLIIIFWRFPKCIQSTSRGKLLVLKNYSHFSC